MKVALLALVLLSSPFARADIAPIEQSLKKCNEAAQSTAEQTRCADAATKAAEAELNTVYHGIAAKLEKRSTDVDIAKANSESLKRLIMSEEAWTPHRDANCKMLGVSALGLNGEPQIISACLAQVTIERVKELLSIFKN